MAVQDLSVSEDGRLEERQPGVQLHLILQHLVKQLVSVLQIV